MASACRSPAGGSVSPGAKHVSVVLRVGVESRDGDADVAVEEIAWLDYWILAELRVARALALHFDARLEPGSEAEVVDGWRHHQEIAVRVLPGVMTREENIVCVIDQTSSCIRLKNCSSSGSRAAMSSSGIPGVAKTRRHVSPSAALMPCSSPLERPSQNAKPVDRSMPITLRPSSMTV